MFISDPAVSRRQYSDLKCFNTDKPTQDRPQLHVIAMILWYSTAAEGHQVIKSKCYMCKAQHTNMRNNHFDISCALKMSFNSVNCVWWAVIEEHVCAVIYHLTIVMKHQRNSRQMGTMKLQLSLMDHA